MDIDYILSIQVFFIYLFNSELWGHLVTVGVTPDFTTILVYIGALHILRTYLIYWLYLCEWYECRVV